MHIIEDLAQIKKLNYSWSLALGNFDGVHLGHQVLLRRCVQESRLKAWTPAVLLWEPHPQSVLQKKPFKQLTTPRQKFDLIKAQGIEYLIRLPFEQKVASLTPQKFVEQYLKIFQVKKVFVGFNYTFGKDRQGTANLLKKWGEQTGFSVSIIEPIMVEGEIVSSSLIREKYKKGDLVTAAKLLGYYPYVQGRVIPGEKRGRQLGFPTANLMISPRQILPLEGVYAAFVEYEQCFWPAVVNIGKRPTFNKTSLTIEAHILDFQQDLYQKELKIFLIEYLRSECKFATAEGLSTQISEDLKKAKRLFSGVKM